MPRPATGARERFVSATIVLLREGGLAAAGLNEVVAKAKSPKGSLYHYFPAGKTQLIAEAIEVYRETIAEQIHQALSGRASLASRVARLFKSVAQRMGESHFSQSCAVGAVVLDLRAEDAELRALCDDVLAHWAEIVAHHLIEIPGPKRMVAARLLIHLLEGAQLAARASASPLPLHEASHAFAALAHALARDTPHDEGLGRDGAF